MADNPNEHETSYLSEQDIWNVIDFARGMTSIMTPDLLSGRMRDINLNPSVPTDAELVNALADPKASEQKLQAWSQSFEVSSMVYKRLLSYLANLLAFDITYTSTAEGEDYTSKKYKNDLKTVENLLDKFNYKHELAIATREMLRNDAYFGCIRDTGNHFVLQELPPDYCKITGRWEGGFLFSFNMYWFLLPGVDLNLYPAFFKKKYKEIWQSPNSPRAYIPSLPADARGASSWIYWVDVPIDVGVCFKLTPELATRLPYFTPLFSDLLLQPLMRSLQKSASMAAASKMIVGEVPMLNKDAKTAVKDMIAISPDLLGKFMALVKGAISEAVKVASAPLENMQGISFDSENDIYDTYLRTTLASTGVNTNLIFTSEIKPNAIETQLSLNVDEQMMQILYEQFNVFMNTFVNRFTKTYKFSFVFEGSNFFLDRQNRYDRAMGLFDKGIVMPQKIAASLGMKPAELRKHMEEAKANGFMDMLTPPSLQSQIEVAEVQGKQQRKLQEQQADTQLEVQKKQADTQLKVQEKQAEQQEKMQDKQAQQNPAPGAKTSGAQSTPAVSPAKPPKQEGDSAGRPKKKDSEIGEEGLRTREQGTNIGRGGKP